MFCFWNGKCCSLIIHLSFVRTNLHIHADQMVQTYTVPLQTASEEFHVQVFLPLKKSPTREGQKEVGENSWLRDRNILPEPNFQYFSCRWAVPQKTSQLGICVPWLAVQTMEVFIHTVPGSHLPFALSKLSVWISLGFLSPAYCQWPTHKIELGQTWPPQAGPASSFLRCESSTCINLRFFQSVFILFQYRCLLNKYARFFSTCMVGFGCFWNIRDHSKIWFPTCRGWAPGHADVILLNM